VTVCSRFNCPEQNYESSCVAVGVVEPLGGPATAQHRGVALVIAQVIADLDREAAFQDRADQARGRRLGYPTT